jgi:hypothetical protein
MIGITSRVWFEGGALEVTGTAAHEAPWSPCPPWFKLSLSSGRGTGSAGRPEGRSTTESTEGTEINALFMSQLRDSE